MLMCFFYHLLIMLETEHFELVVDFVVVFASKVSSTGVVLKVHLVGLSIMDCKFLNKGYFVDGCSDIW